MRAKRSARPGGYPQLGDWRSAAIGGRKAANMVAARAINPDQRNAPRDGPNRDLGTWRATVAKPNRGSPVSRLCPTGA